MADTLILRADANPRMGTGHVMRCLALAQGWRRTGGQALFVCADITPALEARINTEGFDVRRIPASAGSPEDAQQTIQQARACQPVAGSTQSPWIAADGYQFEAVYQRAIKEAGLRLLLVDDYGHCNHYCADIVLNQNLSARPEWYQHREPHTRLLLGTRYVLLRDQFRAYRDWQRDIAPVARKVLVTLGGADPDNVTGKVIEALRGLDVEAKIVVGGSNPNLEKLKAETGNLKSCELLVNSNDMPALMAWADMAIAAGGTTSWELAFMGLPSLVLVLADNQRDIATALDREGISINLGWHPDVQAAKLAETLRTLLVDAERRATMSQRGRQLVDGCGVARVVKILQGISYRITIASEADSWLNDYLPAFVAELQNDGHAVVWVHKAGDIGSGDFCFLLGFGQIVAGDVLRRHRHNLVVHESDLPHGRGWSPLTWQILEGKHEIPVTLLEAAEAVDSGVIYAQTRLRFRGTELVDELRAAQARATFALCRAFLAEFPESATHARPQTGTPTYYPRRRPEDSRLDPDKSLREQFNLLRVVDNDRYPAFFELDGQRYRLRIEKVR